MLDTYTARTDRIIPARLIEIQTLADEADQLLDAVMQVHPLGYGGHYYEDPVICLREDRASPTAYDHNKTNPNRWWNTGRGLPTPLT